ncbi:MAG TPA: proton-conducting transporter membrane subunit, partial [Ferruginibacter sp.]|nr:proton-conducting transporter membrane subunit [Ferruginibacter sp.]
MNLNWLILLPLLTMLLIVLVRPVTMVRSIALGGALLQMLLALALYGYYQQAGTGMAFEQDIVLYPDWNIHYHIAVDGVSVAMILLTSFVVVAGVLMSWKQSERVKEYFLLLILLGLGAYGFFISQDLLIAFFFLEVAVIPKYLLISIWGSGKKVYSANKLALMLMGGSALILLGLLILYFTGFNRSFDMLLLSKQSIAIETQRLVFPLLFIGFGVFSALFPF